jgi:hypothetical protein
VDQQILSGLRDYLLAHREKITGEWLRAVERDAVISSSDRLEYKELVDHVPALFQDLAELLKFPQSDPNHSEVSGDARVHGKYRWRQGLIGSKHLPKKCRRSMGKLEKPPNT